MTGERVSTPALRLAVFLAVAVLGLAGWLRLAGPDFATAVQRLSDGDLEGVERRALLERLAAVADPGRPVERVAAALSAVALGDLDGFRARTGSRPGELPAIAGDVAKLDAAARDTAAFGDDVLRRLLEAYADEVEQRVDAARARYAEVEQSARLFRMPAAVGLSNEGLARLR